MTSSSSSKTFCGPPLCNAAEGGVVVSRPTTTTTTNSETTTRPTTSWKGTIQPVDSVTIAASTTSSSTSIEYFTYYVYQEPILSDNTLVSWTSETIPASVYDNWLYAMQTAIPRTADPMQEASIAYEVFRGQRYEWMKEMAEDRKSVLISFWLPQWMAPASLDVRSVPATEYSVVFPTYVQFHMLDLYDAGPTSTPTPEATSKEKTVPQKVAVGVSVPLAAVLVFLLIWLLIKLRAQRRQQREDEEQSPSSPKKTKHKRNYNAKPLYPHKSLTGLSETSFTTDPQPSYGAILKQRLQDNNNDNDQEEPDPRTNLPELRGSPTERLPELPGSPTEETELLPTASSSSSDDFGTHFSGLEDPFSDVRRTALAELPSPVPERSVMTPGVSPSSYPLRDRLSHESGRRRQAIEAVRSGEGSWRGSVAEEDLRRMGRVFELEGEEVGVRRSRSFDGGFGRTGDEVGR